MGPNNPLADLPLKYHNATFPVQRARHASTGVGYGSLELGSLCGDVPKVFVDGLARVRRRHIQFYWFGHDGPSSNGYEAGTSPTGILLSLR
jgi:hypothetical protein